jgi:RNA recognition motif-containing protein
MGSTDTNSTTVVQGGGGGGGESKDIVVVDGGVSGDGSVKVHQLDDDDRALKLGDKIDRDIYNRMKRFESLQYNVKESTSLTIPSIEQLPVVATSEYLTLESIERRVVIFNLPPDITEEKLTQALRKCGVMSRVWLFRETREVKASLKVKETREEEGKG